MRIHKPVPTSKATKKPPFQGGKFVRLNELDQAAKRIRERSFLEKPNAAAAPMRGTGPGVPVAGGVFALNEPPTAERLSGAAPKLNEKVWVKV